MRQVTCLVPWPRGWPRRTSHKKVIPFLFGERNCRQEAAERDNKASLGNPCKLTWRLLYFMSSTFSIGVKPIMWCFKYTYPPMIRWRTDRAALPTRTRPPRMRARPPTFSSATANSSGRPLPGVKRREPPGKPSSPMDFPWKWKVTIVEPEFFPKGLKEICLKSYWVDVQWNHAKLKTSLCTRITLLRPTTFTSNTSIDRCSQTPQDVLVCSAFHFGQFVTQIYSFCQQNIGIEKRFGRRSKFSALYLQAIMVIEFFTLWLQQPIRLLQLEAPRHGLTGGGNSFFSGGCCPVDCRGLEFFNRRKKTYMDWRNKEP